MHCVNEVEARGLNEVGIYRVPGYVSYVENQNLEWIICGILKIVLIHEFTCPRTCFGLICLVFFWTKYKIEVIPWVSCYYLFSKKRFINLHLIFFSFSSADSQVKELKKEFMKGKGVPNLVSDLSFRICFVMQSF